MRQWAFIAGRYKPHASPQVPAMTRIGLRRNLWTAVYSLEQKKAYESLLEQLDSLNSDQTPATRTSIHRNIDKLPNKYDLLGYLMRNDNKSRAQHLLSTMTRNLVLINAANLYIARSYDLLASENDMLFEHIKRMIPRTLDPRSKKLLRRLDTNRPINVMVAIYRMAICLDLHVLAGQIIRETVRQSLQTGMGSFLELLNYHNISLYIDLMCVKHPQTDVQDLKQMFRIVSLYDMAVTKHNSREIKQIPLYPFTSSQITAILEKASSSKSTDTELCGLVIRELGSKLAGNGELFSHYSSNTDNKTMTEIGYQNSVDEFLSFCYKFIEDRVSRKDPAAVYRTWRIIEPFHNVFYNSALDSMNNNPQNGYYYYHVMSKIVSCFSKNKRYRHMVDKLVMNLPIEAIKVSPELMASLIYHSARTGNFNLGNILMDQYTDDTLGLPTRFSPNQLSALLALSLKEGKYDRAQEILKFAKDNLVRFDAIEFNELVRAALNDKSNASAAWSMILAANAKTARYAYNSYVTHMMDTNKMDFDKLKYMYDHAIAGVSEKDANFWDYWTLNYFKYIHRKYGYRTGMAIYMRSVSEDRIFDGLDHYKYKPNPYLSRHTNVTLRLSDATRPFVLRDIFQLAVSEYKRAVKAKEDYTVKKEAVKAVSLWCYQEYKQLGFRESDVATDLIRTINKKSRRVGDHRQQIGDSFEERFLTNLLEYEKQHSK
ncbi:hypothetical protein KL949_003091 [Ogataea haglerorum]|nr:hypothetical protein KL913_002753 [Ogataea haglerorum]KAG7718119.1 hypothetical protein KL949_003091 [Ogataea haglerorum]KAG7760861.1 hypothetical protein KL947_000832 [Ogataea haglerorum]KAG7771455.1 hypothetical protein KL931_001153 [Ogataea haglerorum]